MLRSDSKKKSLSRQSMSADSSPLSPRSTGRYDEQQQEQKRFQKELLRRSSRSFSSVEEGITQDGRKEGYLFRKERRFLVKSSNLYWVELDPFNEFVNFYSKPPSLGVVKSKLVGAFSLEGASITGGKEKNEIRIKTKKGKKFTFYAVSFKEKNEWVDALQKAKEFAVSSQELIETWKKEKETGILDYMGGTNFEKEIEQEDTLEIFDEDDKPISEENVVENPISEGQGIDTLQEKLEEESRKQELREFFELRVEDKDGNSVQLKDVLGKNTPTLLVLLRHFGCMLCRQQAGLLLQQQMDFYELGIPIIAIGQGTSLMAKSFAKEFDFPGKIFTDSKKVVYKALNCRRGAKYSLGMKTVQIVKKAYAEGYRQGPTAGDVFQLGGMFVLSQNHGFLYEHLDQFAGDHADLNEVLEFCDEFLKTHPYEQWSNKVPIKKEWSQVKADKDDFSMINPSEIGFLLETGRNKVPYSVHKLMIEEGELDICYFRDNFYGTPHYNYYGDLNGEAVSYNDSNELVLPNPFVLTVEKQGNHDVKAIFRTKKGDSRFFVPIQSCTSEKQVLRYIQSIRPELEKAKFHKMRDLAIGEQLINYENKFLVKNYKFGVLYMKEGQTTEAEMYSNVEVSQDYLDFLQMLGDKVELKGWSKFRGGLDVKDNLHGEHSVYTAFKGFEIMFHVSTMLPYRETDPQQIERKKHLGNDIVLIIFKEGDQPLDPAIFKSQFNHVFGVVQVDKSQSTKDETYYRLAFANKTGVIPYGPYLPDPPVIKKSPYFKEYILTKLVNGERAAMYAPHFNSKYRTRQSYLNEIIQKAIESSSSSNSLSSLTRSNTSNTLKVSTPTQSNRGSLSPGSSPIDLSPRGSTNSIVNDANS